MMDRMYDFLIWCSGADAEILALEDCRTERQKYVGIGATVLLTGIFAFISGSYALYRVFINVPGSSLLALLTGAIWGLTIFNMDRLMVGSIRKTDSKSQQLIAALPRLGLAILISLVVSKPLEVRIFSDRIAVQIDEMRRKAEMAGAQEAEAINQPGRYANQVQQLDGDISTLQRRLGREPDTESVSRVEWAGAFIGGSGCQSEGEGEWRSGADQPVHPR